MTGNAILGIVIGAVVWGALQILPRPSAQDCVDCRDVQSPATVDTQTGGEG